MKINYGYVGNVKQEDNSLEHVSHGDMIKIYYYDVHINEYIEECCMVVKYDNNKKFMLLSLVDNLNIIFAEECKYNMNRKELLDSIICYFLYKYCMNNDFTLEDLYLKMNYIPNNYINLNIEYKKEIEVYGYEN
jgi:hypothetical protein